MRLTGTCDKPVAATAPAAMPWPAPWSQHLPEARLGGASAGLHLIAWLPDGADEQAIADRAAARGVAIHTLHRDCFVVAPVNPALLLGYGLIAEPAIPRAVAELADAARL